MIRARGFTLIELAIVLVILTVLIGGLAMPLTAQIEARRIAETKKTLEEAREAIIGYAMSNTAPGTCDCAYDAETTTLNPGTSNCPVSLCPATGTTKLTLPIARPYLPCPDLTDNDLEPDQDNDDDGSMRDLNNGREDRYKGDARKGECLAGFGNLPWVTLGVGQQDAWGNRLRYVVTEEFANGTSGFHRFDVGDIEICRSSDCPDNTHAADDIVAAIISHGPNGWGARSIHDGMLRPPASPDERRNVDLDRINDKTRLVSRPPTAADSAPGEFDDLVVWLSAAQLRSRVCSGGGCP
jgi:prepilin-type N-terminal cleavage/methylation domain-containing protein